MNVTLPRRRRTTAPQQGVTMPAAGMPQRLLHDALRDCAALIAAQLRAGDAAAISGPADTAKTDVALAICSTLGREVTFLADGYAPPSENRVLLIDPFSALPLHQASSAVDHARNAGAIVLLIDRDPAHATALLKPGETHLPLALPDARHLTDLLVWAAGGFDMDELTPSEVRTATGLLLEHGCGWRESHRACLQFLLAASAAETFNGVAALENAILTTRAAIAI